MLDRGGINHRGTVRATGVAKNTITKLLVDLGDACSYAANELVVDVEARRVQCDEIWSFCYSKAKNVPEDHRGEFGRQAHRLVQRIRAWRDSN